MNDTVTMVNAVVRHAVQVGSLHDGLRLGDHNRRHGDVHLAFGGVLKEQHQLG